MAEASGPCRDSSYHSSELNAQLAALTPELRKRYGIPGEGEGVLVLDIKEGSVFEQGLRPGDVIRKVEGNAVESPQQVERLVDAAKSASESALLLLVRRRGQELFLGVKPSDASRSPAPPWSAPARATTGVQGRSAPRRTALAPLP